MGFSSPHFEQVFSSTGTLPLAAYNLKFAEKQKSGWRRFAITGLAAHTQRHPYTRQGEGEEKPAGQTKYITSFVYVKQCPLYSCATPLSCWPLSIRA
jgi:hypothetical protein